MVGSDDKSKSLKTEPKSTAAENFPEKLTKDEEFIITEFLDLILTQPSYQRKNNASLLSQLLARKRQRDIYSNMRNNREKFMVINDREEN